jgi:hypothetical protein
MNMKKPNLLLLVATLTVAVFYYFRMRADEPLATFQTMEFLTIRWEGRENSHVIRPNGKVEKLKSAFDRFPRPTGMDEKSFYLNVAMNAVAKEGYELAAMTNDEIVMKRPPAR